MGLAKETPARTATAPSVAAAARSALGKPRMTRMATTSGMITNAIERVLGRTRDANAESRATTMRAAAAIRLAADPSDNCQGALLGDELDMTAMELKVSMEVQRTVGDAVSAVARI